MKEKKVVIVKKKEKILSKKKNLSDALRKNLSRRKDNSGSTQSSDYTK